MPADNLVRKALQNLEAIDNQAPLQRHIRLLVAQAYLDGAIEMALLESTAVKPWDLPPTEADLRDAAWSRRLAWALNVEVNLRRYGTDVAQQEQWAAAIEAGVAGGMGRVHKAMVSAAAEVA